ncbi:Signal recognition particle protein [Gracilariopsis chorda]|uniref:signal-recognition-particle GTPase n=1 Tax=Gracilariopsis chorda TaxID=448386 RepID=A0A2V3IRY4_9FLOR|nr:Signal recognition particle protein [Gracilariopsis chorda]|eukprot:PXF44869.1 Signal recognition particle protein [Gracilariopsis chorda]
MLFDSLTEKMGETVRKLRGVDKITEKNVAGAMKQVKRALLDADVNLRVVNGLIKQIKERAIGAEVVPGVDPGQMLIKIMHEELTEIMGKDQAPLAKRSDGQPTVVLLAGLQGAGKTTAAAKLALYCLKDKRSVMLIAGDVYRPAAIDQLKTLGDMINVDVFSMGTDADPRDIIRKGIEKGKENKIDTLIVDTAGRQVIDAKLMKELKDVKDISKPDETLLVVDAMTGQEAATLTRSFNEEVGITGAILTKLDGDTRGGAALSVQQVSGAPIKFIGVGEKVEKLEPFIPERMASRILGMGDVLTFVERAKEQMDEREAEKMTKRMMEAKFDFNDFLKQTKMISSMGSLAGVMKMLPGVGSISSAKMAQAEAKLKLADSLIKSMTVKERTNPELLYSGGSARSRILRISKGAGRSRDDAEDLVKDFLKMRDMMSRMSKQMVNGQGGPGGSGQPAGNRSQRRKAAKKKAQKRTAKRGFG